LPLAANALPISCQDVAKKLPFAAIPDAPPEPINPLISIIKMTLHAEPTGKHAFFLKPPLIT